MEFKKVLVLMVVSVGVCSGVFGQNTSDSTAISKMLELGEVVVKGTGGKTVLNGNALVTTIKGSSLEHVGTAEDVLNKVPGLVKTGDGLEVIGRGAPLYYINGRKVLDNDELRQLMSEEIKSVEVISNPGAAYGGDVLAVVRIKTIKRDGEGLSYALTSQARQFLTKSAFCPSWTVLDLNYRKGGLDWTGKIIYWNNKSYSSNDVNVLTKNGYAQEIDMMGRGHNTGLSGKFGINWQISSDHSLGFYVQRENNFFVDIFDDNKEEMSHNGIVEDVLTSECNEHWPGKDNYSWMGNAYYNGKIGKMGIDINTDFISQNSADDRITNEKSTVADASVSSNTDNNVTMIATKGVLSYPIWEGKLEAGVEEIYFSGWEKYKISGAAIPSTDMDLKENTIAAFAEYGVKLPFGMLSAGLRYEHVNYDFKDKLTHNMDLSKKYDNFFPSLSFSTRLGEVGLSLSYSGKTQRPKLYWLTSEVKYHSRYIYETGNPMLQSENRQNFSLNSKWRWLSMSLNYERINSACLHWIMLYEGSQDVDILKLTNINHDKPVRQFSAYVVAQPAFGIWHPRYTAGIVSQHLDISSYSYNKPMYLLQLNNSFNFGKNWQVDLDYRYISKFSKLATDIENCTHDLSFSVQKSLLKNDALTFRLAVSDILDHTVAITNIRADAGTFWMKQDNFRPCIDFRVSYRFNSAKDRYKGRGAGDSVKERM